MLLDVEEVQCLYDDPKSKQKKMREDKHEESSMLRQATWFMCLNDPPYYDVYIPLLALASVAATCFPILPLLYCTSTERTYSALPNASRRVNNKWPVLVSCRDVTDGPHARTRRWDWGCAVAPCACGEDRLDPAAAAIGWPWSPATT